MEVSGWCLARQGGGVGEVDGGFFVGEAGMQGLVAEGAAGVSVWAKPSDVRRVVANPMTRMERRRCRNARGFTMGPRDVRVERDGRGVLSQWMKGLVERWIPKSYRLRRSGR